MAPLSPWDDGLVEELKRLITVGCSAHDIAAELGHGLTRNAVLGKINRLGLSKPREPSKPGEVRPRRYKPRMVRRLMVITPALQPQPEPPPPLPDKREWHQAPGMRKLQLLALQDHHCRAPIGDPGRHPFYFCAADRKPGDSYCPFHMRKAYAKPRGG